MYTTSCLYAHFLDYKISLLHAPMIFIRNQEANQKKRLYERKINQEHERSKQFEDYNWAELLRSDSLQNLRVWQLNNSLESFMLRNAKNLRKQQKLLFLQKRIVFGNN